MKKNQPGTVRSLSVVAQSATLLSVGFASYANALEPFITDNDTFTFKDGTGTSSGTANAGTQQISVVAATAGGVVGYTISATLVCPLTSDHVNCTGELVNPSVSPYPAILANVSYQGSCTTSVVISGSIVESDATCDDGQFVNINWKCVNQSRYGVLNWLNSTSGQTASFTCT